MLYVIRLRRVIKVASEIELSCFTSVLHIIKVHVR